MSQLVITLPADTAEWGPLVPVGVNGGMQTCQVSLGGKNLCQVVVVWPTLPPTAPMEARIDGRHGGDRD